MCFITIMFLHEDREVKTTLWSSLILAQYFEKLDSHSITSFKDYKSCSCVFFFFSSNDAESSLNYYKITKISLNMSSISTRFVKRSWDKTLKPSRNAVHRLFSECHTVGWRSYEQECKLSSLNETTYYMRRLEWRKRR